MSSNPSKIVIQPKKKKKKKPLIIVSKKKSASIIVGAPTQSQPPSPNTVVPSSSSFGTASTANNNNTKGVKKKSNIIIKPYTKPPTLPTNFYDTSLSVLKTSLYCVLRHEKAVASLSSGSSDDVNSSANTGGTERLIGREELYRSVEDLCVHKLGTKLYYDIVTIINDSAAEIIQRLSMPSSGSSGNGEGNSLTAISDKNGTVGYNSTQLINELNLKDGGTTSNTSNESSYINKRYQLLQNLHSICRQSYAEEYITFVRSIFLALDRQFVYYSNVDLEEIGNRSASGSGVEGKGKLKVDESAMDIDTPASSADTTTKDSNSPPGGNVIERSSASSNNSRVWSLWEVGIACLRQQMVNCSPTSQQQDDTTTLSVLTAMILTTTYAILSEYDNDNDNNTNTQSLMMDNSRPLIRNCVRTIIDLGSLPSLLEELIVVASTRFEKEGQLWQMKLTEGTKSASEFLLFVEHRLRQSGVLSGYYLPSNVESVNALRRLSQVDVLKGAVPSSSSTSSSSSKEAVSWSSANNSTRRLFPAIIEKQLLGPMLLTPNAGILESRHLYPMLDDSDVVGGDMAWKSSGAGNKKTYENAKRLYGLCWRMTQSTASSAVSSPSQQPLAVGGNKLPPSALDLLRLAFGEYGRLRGGEIIKQGLTTTSGGTTSSNVNTKELEKKIVPDLLAFKNHLAALHEVAFRKDDSFASMLRSILDDVLNGSTAGGSSSMTSDDNEGDGGRRIAELLAKHVDLRFKDTKASAASSSGNTSSSNLLSDANEAFQAEILALFRHIHSKDVFEAFYKRDLAKRLLTGRAVSTDMERSFLSKLKAECGAGYTSKMEGMFKDMDLSREIMGNYSAYSAGAGASIEPSSGGKTPDMDVQVLTTGNWPTYPKYPGIILPPELLAQRSKFEKYYNDKYQGRRIVWQYSLGNCIVKASFPKSAAPKELIVNVCQSLVLLCFKDGHGDDDQGLTLDDIVKRTGIDDKAEMERVLQSLSMGREGTRVLKKVDYDSPTQSASSSSTKVDGESPSKAKKKRVRRNVGPYDRFLFNSSFTSNQRRIRITNITMKETSEERKKTHAAVSKDRLYFIDAAVVRIMKARKTIDHRGLIGEVMAQLKFPVTAADIKKRVESLIEREYMERVESDRSKYKYLA